MRINGILSLKNLCHVCVMIVLLNTFGCCCPPQNCCYLPPGCCWSPGWLANKSGMHQYKRGHYALAHRRFARAIARDPYNPDYRHNLAMTLQKEGDVGGCERILRYNVSMDPMHQPTYHSLAQLMVAQGRAPEAQELLTTWVETQPYVPEANIEMAWLMRETGDVSGAEYALQNALRADPGHPVALAHLGELYETSGRSDQAVAYYQRSLASEWNQPEVQTHLQAMREGQPISRSAMMQNQIGAPMMADGAVFGEPMMADATPMMTQTSMTAMANEFEKSDAGGPRSRRQVRRINRRGNGMPVMASYPLPNYGSTSSEWYPADPMGGTTIVGLQSPTMSAEAATLSQIPLPPLTPSATADSISSPNVTIPNGPTPIAQFDPAHANESTQEMTASLPVVDPH